MRLSSVGIWIAIASPVVAACQSSPGDTTRRLKLGALVDTYYAYDFNRPLLRDRPFTTQAARHNEFNVNLAFLEASLAAQRIRGRVAIQLGTSVQANYAAEPSIGDVSGPDVSRFIQEAVVGYAVTRRLWLDAGIFLSSIGSESWISRDNWTYTRSLIAENSPYYESGIKATWQPSAKVSAQVHLLNGWQNISENNSRKAFLARADFTPSPKVGLAYDVFVGNEAPDSLEKTSRMLHDGILTLTISQNVQVRGTVDYGVQYGGEAGRASWWGYSLIGRVGMSPRLSSALRAERFVDDHQIIVTTGLPYGFRASGWSVNLDFEPASGLLSRLEYRELSGGRSLYPSSGPELRRRDRVAVASVSLTF